MHGIVAAWFLALLPGVVLTAMPPAAPPSAASAARAPSTPRAPSAPTASREDYRILSERNIFLRNRTRPTTGRLGSGGATAAAPSTGDDRMVLTGVIQEGQDYVAFFEDTRTGKTTQAKVDALVGRGRLTAITLDAVQYACDGRTTKVAIGSSLAGIAASFPRSMTTTAAAAAPGAGPGGPAPMRTNGAPGLPPGAPPEAATASTTLSPTTPAPPAAGAPSETTDPGTAAILERMRQRREREINR